MMAKCVTCTAPVNIAVVKYWGKRHEDLLLPVNDSLSITLDQNQLRAKTTVMASKSFTEDRMWLNGREEFLKNVRLQNVFREIKRRAGKRKNSGDESGDDMCSWHLHISSENNFPTAAGLASSAAGFACLVFALAKLYSVDGDVSDIARQGSGSACRSLYGGFVAWTMGVEDNGNDSRAQQIESEEHWPEMHCLLVVVCAGKKHIGSTDGMQRTVETSRLLEFRAKEVVAGRMEILKKAITAKDFQTFAEETMKDSNQMHATCLDTYPPISYMTDVSRDIQKLVHAINDYHLENKVAYTFDAGPNACLFLLKSEVPLVLALLRHYFPPPGGQGSNSYVRGLSKADGLNDVVLLNENLLSRIPLLPNKDAVNYIIHTKVGTGPQVIHELSESLLNEDGSNKVSIAS